MSQFCDKNMTGNEGISLNEIGWGHIGSLKMFYTQEFISDSAIVRLFNDRWSLSGSSARPCGDL